MGTLQTELKKLTELDNLAFDDDPQQQAQPQQTTSAAVTNQEKSKRHIYWEWLRDHPSSTAREMAEALDVSVPDMATIVHTFYERGLVDRRNRGGVYTYHTAVDKYPVLDTAERVRRMTEARKANLEARKANKSKAPRKAKVSKPTDIHILEERKAALRGPEPLRIVSGSVDEILNRLTLTQARDLYDRLRKIFGG